MTQQVSFFRSVLRLYSFMVQHMYYRCLNDNSYCDPPLNNPILLAAQWTVLTPLVNEDIHEIDGTIDMLHDMIYRNDFEQRLIAFGDHGIRQLLKVRITPIPWFMVMIDIFKYVFL